MTHIEYQKLANDLQQLAKIIPLQWGNIQNDGTDKQINMFQILSFEELEKQIANLSDNSKNYFRRRWFLWKCAQCDEHIFCINNNVIPNSNPRDQGYDIEFNNSSLLRFDIKGTVIPREFRNDINAVLQNPNEIVKFFYEKQSTGVRNNIQNRLFIIHHSYRNQEREMYLRCHWAFKINLFKLYSEKINVSSNFIKFQNAKADVIFIFENLDKTITHSFFAV
jgi:hypothetical protein